MLTVIIDFCCLTFYYAAYHEFKESDILKNNDFLPNE